MSNHQHMELEHGREEARLAAKRDLRQQREQLRGQQLWGSASEKAELASRERAEHDALLASRREQAAAERAAHERLQAEMHARERDVRQAELAKVEAKREYLAQLRDENFRLAEQRRTMQQYQRAEEKAVDQQNRGAGFLDKFGRHAY